MGRVALRLGHRLRRCGLGLCRLGCHPGRLGGGLGGFGATELAFQHGDLIPQVLLHAAVVAAAAALQQQ